MTNHENSVSTHGTFDGHEEAWFARPERTTRPSQRPTEPAPAVPGPIDPVIDGWFFDVTT